MNSQHYTASFSVAQSPAAVFAAVTNPRARWSEEIKGPTPASCGGHDSHESVNVP